jgi:hypothetical protein
MALQADRSLHAFATPVVSPGLRGLAHPFSVGYVDIGYGSGGVATFKGINYPI